VFICVRQLTSTNTVMFDVDSDAADGMQQTPAVSSFIVTVSFSSVFTCCCL